MFNGLFSRNVKPRSRMPMTRRIRLEQLERRQLLSASPLAMALLPALHHPTPSPALTILVPCTIVENTTVVTGTVSVNTGNVAANTTVTLTGSDNGAELNLVQSATGNDTVVIAKGTSSTTFTITPVVNTTS